MLFLKNIFALNSKSSSKNHYGFYFQGWKKISLKENLGRQSWIVRLSVVFILEITVATKSICTLSHLL